MKATISLTGGRAPPGRNRRWPCAGSRWPGAARGSPPPAPSFFDHVAGHARPLARVDLGLLDSLVQRLGRAVDFLSDRHHRRATRRMIALVVQHPPHRALAHLKRKLVRRLVAHNGPYLSGVGASGNPGACVDAPGFCKGFLTDFGGLALLSVVCQASGRDLRHGAGMQFEGLGPHRFRELCARAPGLVFPVLNIEVLAA